MKVTCHSETGILKSVMLKRPAAAFVDDSLLAQQWQHLHYLSEPNLEKAIAEYHDFENYIRTHEPAIFYLPEDDTVTIDSIYCRDASIATDGGMIICNMGKPARSREPYAVKKCFEDNGIAILGEIKDPGTLEGGDVVWLDKNTLAVGHTYRTNAAGLSQLKNILSPLNVEVIVVPLPHYKGPGDVFHLMSILSPVDRDLAVIYSPLMPIAFREYLLNRGYRLVEVNDEEFESMGCNVLAIAPSECLVVDGNPRTRAALEKEGCVVRTYSGIDISLKGGGGPTCLTRPLFRGEH